MRFEAVLPRTHLFLYASPCLMKYTLRGRLVEPAKAATSEELWGSSAVAHATASDSSAQQSATALHRAMRCQAIAMSGTGCAAAAARRLSEAWVRPPQQLG